MKLRVAKIEDAEQLEKLNDAFNGVGETTLEHIKENLNNNKQEVVIVAEENNLLVAFLCIQLKKSFCYDDYMPEITELYVEPKYRREGLSQDLLEFAVQYCKENFPCHKVELLTGKENANAQKAYLKFGFYEDDDLHLSKKI